MGIILAEDRVLSDAMLESQAETPETSPSEAGNAAKLGVLNAGVLGTEPCVLVRCIAARCRRMSPPVSL
ncbi:MAG: hypothetical protein EOO65_03955 [Methanosarcinales archaeon]|nr:MAG: hypothetical protein EOO65_03955 [Methanosarcinales archaeon]